VYAIGSAVFAALTSILGKIGITGVESNLGTALRTVVVLVMAWIVVGVAGEVPQLRKVARRDLTFIVLSGVATGASWLCYYRALQLGPASLVVPIDKLSILVTIAFATFVLHEKLRRRAVVGLVLILAGTLLMLLPAPGS
jgi:transporter family protein